MHSALLTWCVMGSCRPEGLRLIGLRVQGFGFMANGDSAGFICFTYVL